MIEINDEFNFASIALNLLFKQKISLYNFENIGC